MQRVSSLDCYSIVALGKVYVIDSRDLLILSTWWMVGV